MTGQLSRHEQEDFKLKLLKIAYWISPALDVTITRQDRMGKGPKTSHQKRRETPLPFNDTASQVAYDLHSTLTAWIEHVCGERDYPWPGMMRTPDAALWLIEHVVGLAITDEAREAVGEIDHAFDRAIRTIDRPLLKSFQGTCEVCGADLFAKPRDKRIICNECATTVDKHVNDQRIVGLLEERSYTANELVGIIRDRFGVTVKPKSIHDMAYRKTNPIPVRGATYDRQKLYRAGDVFYSLRQRKVIA
jgi:hypothetical protein